MSSEIQLLIKQLNSAASDVSFEQVMQVIAKHYDYTPTTFSNGELTNVAGTNEGSCKIFAFAKLHQLSESATLNCFGQFYHDDVLNNPQGTDHGNIRNFLRLGWVGISFEQDALIVKNSV